MVPQCPQADFSCLKATVCITRSGSLATLRWPFLATRLDFAAVGAEPSSQWQASSPRTSREIKQITEVLEASGFTAEDVALVIPHQANQRITDMVTRRMKLPPEKVFSNIERYGNTTAASIPLALSEAVRAGKLKRGDLLVTVAFGSGFTWGANLIRW